MSFANLEEKLDDAKAQSGTDNRETYPRVKLTPEAAVGGTIVDVGYTGDTSIEQNIRGGESYRDEGDFVFTLEDPEVIRGTLFAAQMREEAEDNLAKNFDDPYPFDARTPSRDFRVVPENWESVSYIDESAEKIDGEWEDVGIDIYGSQFVGHPADSFDDALSEYDRVQVFVGGQAGRIMMRSLDVMQQTAAYIDSEGTKVPGLVEFPLDYNNGSEMNPRAATRPEIHPALEDAQIGLFLHFGDLDLDGEETDDEDDGEDRYSKHFGDVLWDSDDGTHILTQEDDVLEARPDETDRPTYLTWHEPEGGFGSSDEGDEGESDDGSSFDFDELDGDDEGGLTMGDLDSSTTDFVYEAAEFAEQSGGIDGAFDNWDETVDKAIVQGEIEDRDADELRTLVEEEMDT